MFEAIWKGIILGLMLCISVGPVLFSIIKQSINNGHKGGYYFISGVALSDLMLILGCTIFTTVFQSLKTHQFYIGVFGSIFLFIMGLYNIFFKKPPVIRNDDAAMKVFRKRELAGIFFSGFFMNLVNPSVIIFWLATSTAISASSSDTTHPERFIITVFATCLIFNTCSDIAKVLLANKIRSKLTPHNIHIINKISGAIFLIFGCVILWGTLSKL